MSEQEQAQTRQDIEARIIAKAWKDEAYKQELVTNPKAVIEREFGVEFPADVNVQVLEENPTSLHFVLPISPVAIAQELSEEQLEAIAGGKDWRVELAKGALSVGLAITLVDTLKRLTK
ncbi:NHLP leader peptide family RiPP precursor [Nostoc punctiforme]|uniref:Nitrile hydratase-like protein n=1 Tax=Nostoc punctiforme (strain ATCC 29133 / PCC 73102) TaxID=63737 RepID=B2IYS9_NOSP7|nr:NHLP leader peptide family RiPP precursor [Nostoc punctiforme]ACC81662.1 nitrile hydratase-like protein [Nostoc punctiforme PCC 73102]